MKIENQVSNVKLSMKLEQLGLKQDSVWYWEIETYKFKPYKGQQHIFLLNRLDKQKVSNDYDYEYYSAFTVAELEQQIFQIIGECRYDFIVSFSPLGGTWKDETFDKMYTVQCVDWSSLNKSLMERAGTGADARATMLIYLLENRLISK